MSTPEVAGGSMLNDMQELRACLQAWMDKAYCAAPDRRPLEISREFVVRCQAALRNNKSVNTNRGRHGEA